MTNHRDSLDDVNTKNALLAARNAHAHAQPSGMVTLGNIEAHLDAIRAADEVASLFRWQDDGYYFGKRKVSNFIIKPIWNIKIDHDHDSMYECHLVVPGKVVPGDTEPENTLHVIVLTDADFANNTRFREKLPRGAGWFGNTDMLQMLKVAVTTQVFSDKIATRRLGVFVHENMVSYVAAGSHMFINDRSDPNDLVSKLRNITSKEQEACAARMPDIAQGLISMNDPWVLMPWIGWYAACPLKPFLPSMMKFPMMNVWGTKNTGKTTVTNILMEMFGGYRSGDSYVSCHITMFALAKLASLTTTIPIHLDEYRTQDFSPEKLNVLHSTLRQAYDGTEVTRGVSSQRLKRYKMSAPVCLVGESAIKDPALLDRSVCAAPSPSDRNSSAKDEFLTLPFRGFSAGYIPWCLEQRFTLKDRLRAAHAEVSAFTKNTSVTSRNVEGLSVALVGWHLFCEYAESLGWQRPPWTIADLCGGTINERQDGRTMLEEFIEDVSTMIFNETVNDGHYKIELDIESDEDIIYIWSKHFYNEIIKQRRLSGSPGLLGLESIMRMAKEELGVKNGLVVAVDRQKKLRKVNHKCLALHAGNIKARLGIDFDIRL